MPRSAAFTRIKQQVPQIVAEIPVGTVCRYQSIGAHLDVMPRHVACILAQLDPSAKMACPWHRMVSAVCTSGVVKRGPDGATQADLLTSDGVTVVGSGIAGGLARVAVEAGLLPHGLSPQTRVPGTGTRGPARRKS